MKLLIMLLLSLLTLSAYGQSITFGNATPDYRLPSVDNGATTTWTLNATLNLPATYTNGTATANNLWTLPDLAATSSGLVAGFCQTNATYTIKVLMSGSDKIVGTGFNGVASATSSSRYSCITLMKTPDNDTDWIITSSTGTWSTP